MRQCFVVCPFGNRDRSAEERRLADELDGLYAYIFVPLEERCRSRGQEIKIYDGREISLGRVLGTTQEHIDVADVVFVVLTADKPNIFLELGWADGMWQSPILLMKEGYIIPSDISDKIGVKYTDRQIRGEDPAGAERVVGKLAALLLDKRGVLTRTERETSFEHLPKSTLATGAIRLYNRFSQALNPKEWSLILQNAEQEIILASTKLSRIREQHFFWVEADGTSSPIRFDSLLLRKALQGVRVTLLMYHEDNYNLSHMKQLHEPEDLEKAKTDIHRAYIRWCQQQLSFRQAWQSQRRSRSRKQSPELTEDGFRVVQIRDRHLPFRVTLTERRAMVTLRFYTEGYNSGLCIDARPNPSNTDRWNIPVFNQIKSELDFLIDENLAASKTRYLAWEKESRKRA